MVHPFNRGKSDYSNHRGIYCSTQDTQSTPEKKTATIVDYAWNSYFVFFHYEHCKPY